MVGLKDHRLTTSISVLTLQSPGPPFVQTTVVTPPTSVRYTRSQTSSRLPQLFGWNLPTGFLLSYIHEPDPWFISDSWIMYSCFGT